MNGDSYSQQNPFRSQVASNSLLSGGRWLKIVFHDWWLCNWDTELGRNTMNCVGHYKELRLFPSYLCDRFQYSILEERQRGTELTLTLVHSSNKQFSDTSTWMHWTKALSISITRGIHHQIWLSINNYLSKLYLPFWSDTNLLIYQGNYMFSYTLYLHFWPIVH